jgi:hypothetical protein
MVQLPYRPDLVPSDFWLFRYRKSPLSRSKSNEPDKLLEAITAILDEIASKKWMTFLWSGSQD